MEGQSRVDLAQGFPYRLYHALRLCKGPHFEQERRVAGRPQLINRGRNRLAQRTVLRVARYADDLEIRLCFRTHEGAADAFPKGGDAREEPAREGLIPDDGLGLFRTLVRSLIASANHN